MDHYERTMHRQLAAFYARRANYLFPNTPIEVRIEEGRGSMLYFAVWEEGEWYHDCHTIRELDWVVKHLVKVSVGWATPSGRMNPSWPKWSQVNIANMCEICEDLYG